MQVGESLDPSVFDPESVQRPLPLPGKAKFNFLTNGKWEKRKGWDVLLKAYYEVMPCVIPAPHPNPHP